MNDPRPTLPDASTSSSPIHEFLSVKEAATGARRLLKPVGRPLRHGRVGKRLVIDGDDLRESFLPNMPNSHPETAARLPRRDGAPSEPAR